MLNDLNKLQTKIMVYVKWWCDKKKTVVPQKEIIIAMQIEGVKSYTALNAINSLIDKGYIRKAYTEHANRTYYVMIRSGNSFCHI